jgi:hypothetical protein
MRRAIAPHEHASTQRPQSEAARHRDLSGRNRGASGAGWYNPDA